MTLPELREALSYDPTTGEFRWLVSRNSYRGKVNPGDLAGSIGGRGYLQIGINGRKYKASRLAWLFSYNRWPTNFIDHINGQRTDNRLCNLREATNAQNQCNRKPTSASGYKGVYKHTQINKWVAEIKHQGVKYSLGCYETADEAHKVRSEAAKKIHGEFSYEYRA